MIYVFRLRSATRQQQIRVHLTTLRTCTVLLCRTWSLDYILRHAIDAFLYKILILAIMSHTYRLVRYPNCGDV